MSLIRRFLGNVKEDFAMAYHTKRARRCGYAILCLTTATPLSGNKGDFELTW